MPKTYAPLGIAAIKAVICAKFMVLGSAFHLGERFAKPPLISSTLYRSFAFLVLLIILNVIEEAVIGMLHGKTVLEELDLRHCRRGLVSNCRRQASSCCILSFPYFTFALISVMSSATKYLFACSSSQIEEAVPKRVAAQANHFSACAS